MMKQSKNPFNWINREDYNKALDSDNDVIFATSGEGKQYKVNMPNAETIEAMEEVKKLKEDPYKKTYNSFDELMKDTEKTK